LQQPPLVHTVVHVWRLATIMLMHDWRQPAVVVIYEVAILLA
jgi:hypothetical protein